jgi:hypothetical protein
VNSSLGSRYVLHDVLRRGAMGEVFRRSVRESGAPVAVKVRGAAGHSLPKSACLRHACLCAYLACSLVLLWPAVVRRIVPVLPDRVVEKVGPQSFRFDP